ncbi:MAG TPA: peptidoglycan DD-metalloendopeptidase family protein [Chthoniobacterales bacterium]|nr:peptidoglycan DD-metalloendopeptidase family protein [Chthoniobacterales bacterium]
MVRTVSIALVSFLALLGQTNGQEVFVPRDTSAAPAVVRVEKAIPIKESPKTQTPKTEPARELAKALPVNVQPLKEPAKASTVKAQAAKTQPAIAPAIKAQPLRVAMVKAQPALAQSVREVPGALQPAQQATMAMETAFTKLADGFDFPVGKPDAQGYYKARGFRSKGHLGEDWDGVRGGDTDLGDPIYSIGNGIVVFAHDCHMGWGNVIIVRHTYREGGEIKNIDALYGHLNSMLVRRGQSIARGQQIATMGTAHGLYDAHLHLEIRKNLEIGMSRAKFARDFSNYYDPSQFIVAHRHLQASDGKYRVALNTFTYDSKINWASKRNYSSYRGGGSESAAALKRAVASQGR